MVGKDTDQQALEHPQEGSESPEEEGQKECTYCKDVPESIICLGCEHDICIMCAARVILNAQDIKVPYPRPKKPKSIIGY
jgi:hypothetical protein